MTGESASAQGGNQQKVREGSVGPSADLLAVLWLCAGSYAASCRVRVQQDPALSQRAGRESVWTQKAVQDPALYAGTAFLLNTRFQDKASFFPFGIGGKNLILESSEYANYYLG